MVVVDVSLIAAIRSGGQTGVDRGALDAARACGVRIEGWCPHGGWAEDFPASPGLLAHYPELIATPHRDPAQRTEWNVRDSHATLILVNPRHNSSAGSSVGHSLDFSPGTEFTVSCARAYGRPWQVVALDDISATRQWLASYGCGLTVNVAGPRGSEEPAAYNIAFRTITGLLGSELETQ